MNIHAAVQRWGRIGTTGRRRKKRFCSKELMNKTVESWVTRRISKGWEEKTEEVQDVLSRIGLINTLKRVRKSISPDSQETSHRIRLPGNWGRIRPLLEPAEAAIYENYNDSRTRHRRDHLSLKYTTLLGLEAEEEYWEAHEIAWKLLRTAQLRFLLSLNLYSPTRQEAGIYALEELCKDLKRQYPERRKHIIISLQSMEARNLSIKKSERQVAKFIDMVSKDIELAKGVGSGGTSLDRVKILKSLTAEDDADLLEDYG
jgi:hypothetical protein